MIAEISRRNVGATAGRTYPGGILWLLCSKAVDILLIIILIAGILLIIAIILLIVAVSLLIVAVILLVATVVAIVAIMVLAITVILIPVLIPLTLRRGPVTQPVAIQLLGHLPAVLAGCAISLTVPIVFHAAVGFLLGIGLRLRLIALPLLLTLGKAAVLWPETVGAPMGLLGLPRGSGSRIAVLAAGLPCLTVRGTIAVAVLLTLGGAGGIAAVGTGAGRTGHIH